MADSKKQDPTDSKATKTAKSSIGGTGGLKAAKERSTHSSVTSFPTTVSESRDPLEFLTKRGYEYVETIAEGGFSVVYHTKKSRERTEDGVTTSTTCHMAVKVFDLSDPSQAVWIKNCLKTEMVISKYLKHPNIVFTYDVIKTRDYGYIVMDLAPNGSIKSDITDRLKRPYTNEEAKKYFSGLCTGLQYMHSQNIAHRDLKLDNFLLTAQWVPMLGDFGFAARASKQTEVVLTQMLRKTRCGTKGYMAPEMYRKLPQSKQPATDSTSKSSLLPNESASEREGYYDAKAVDIYSMGVCLYEMFNLCKPYSCKMNDTTLDKIINQEYDYNNPRMEPACKELIGKMLKFKSEARPKVEEVLKHRWLTLGSMVNRLLASVGL